MPHVVTTRHDLLINHGLTIHLVTIVPKYCGHCCGTLYMWEDAFTQKQHADIWLSLSSSGPLCQIVWLTLLSRPHVASGESSCRHPGCPICFHLYFSLMLKLLAESVCVWLDWHHLKSRQVIVCFFFLWWRRCIAFPWRAWDNWFIKPKGKYLCNDNVIVILMIS